MKLLRDFLCAFLSLTFLLLANNDVLASARAGTATVKEGSSTSISLASAYETTLRRATSVSARWWSENSSYVSVGYSNNYSASITGVRATPTYSPCKVYYSCSYYIDGFYRTMDFYYEVTVESSTVYVTSVSLSQNSATITEGEGLNLYATVYPTYATNRNVTWSSSNSSVASVTSSGYVYGNSAGSASITCRASDGSGQYDVCYVTVKSKTVYVSSISLNKSNATLKEDETLQLSATISPSNATNKSVTWSSSNSSVASVSSTGKVTAKSAGTCNITCRANDGSGKYAICQITVESKAVKVTGITLDKTSATLTTGETLQLNATVTPSNATNKSVAWSSSNSSVASVSSTGNVTALAEGNATITCKAADGSNISAKCEITVEPEGVKIEEITLDVYNATLEKGESLLLYETIIPPDANNKVNWTSSDPEVASVSSYGYVYAKKAGVTTITCESAENSEIAAYCEIAVTEKDSMFDKAVGKYNVTYELVTATTPSKEYDITFEFEISEIDGTYWITSMFGEDLTTYNDGGFRLCSYGDGHFFVNLSYSNILSYDEETGYLYALYGSDENEELTSTWDLILNEDGTLSLQDIYVAAFLYDETKETWLGNIEAAYFNMTTNKVGSSTAGDNVLKISNIKAKTGNKVTLPVNMINKDNISGFQFNLSVPNGVSVEDVDMTERANKLTASYNFSENVYKFAVLSISGKTITGNNGDVMDIQLSVSKDIADGVYDIKISSIKIFTDSGDELDAPECTAKMEIKSITIGDVNNNGEINTNDAIAIVNYVIGKKPSVFVEDAADVNGNGEINTNDAIAIVNYVIGKNNSLKSKQYIANRKNDFLNIIKEKKILNNSKLH